MPGHSANRLLVAIAFAVGSGAGGGFSAALAQPTLTHVVPAAVSPGQSTQLMLHGTKLTGPLRVWTTFPAQAEVAAIDPKAKDVSTASGTLTLPAGTPLGIGGIAVVNNQGASDVAFVMIDDLPSVTKSGDNHAASTAQEIALPAAIDGQSDGTLPDYYRFAAKAGERISCEVVATRLGWDFDSLITLFDAAGRELLQADDNPATGPDARFVFTAPADGQYLLEVRDNRYKPGGRYRLRLGEFPLISVARPLVAQRGVVTPVTWRGPHDGASPPADVLPLGGAVGAAACSLSANLPGRPQSGYGLLGLTDLPVCAATRSVAAAEGAARVALPCVVSDVLESPGSRALYEFQATKGAAIRFKSLSRSLGSPAVVTLRVLDAAGKQLAESPVTDSDEPVLPFTPPADGLYRLAVEELVGRGGSDYAFAVECRTGPQFSLLLKNDKNNRLRYALPPGGALALDVQCQRAGYDGPIDLEIDSPHSGWQLVNNTIPAKANEVRMYVLPPLGFASGSLAALRVVGRGEAGGKPLSATMTTTLQLRAARPQTPYPPSWQEGAILVSGTAAKAAFYQVAAAASAVEWNAAAGQAQVTLDLERTSDKFKDPLTIIPIGLPAGITAEIKRNGNGPKETYDIILKGKQLPAGDHAFRYLAYAELSGQGRGVLSGEIRLKVAAKEEPATAAAEAKSP